MSASPFADDETLLVTEARRHRGRDEEQDQPEVGEQGRQLRVLVAVAVEETRAVGVGRLADVEARSCAGRVRTSSGGTAVHRRAVRQARVEERLGLGDPDVADAAPQPRRPVEGADDDRE